MLPQHSDIEIARYASIQQEPNGWKTVTTQFYIREFSEYIAPLQDAVDLEIATEEERSLLEAWNKYRVLLNRVDTSTAPDIEWPANPCRGNHWDYAADTSYAGTCCGCL